MQNDYIGIDLGKEEYRVGPVFSGCVMGFSRLTVMIS